MEATVEVCPKHTRLLIIWKIWGGIFGQGGDFERSLKNSLFCTFDHSSKPIGIKGRLSAWSQHCFSPLQLLSYS